MKTELVADQAQRRLRLVKIGTDGLHSVHSLLRKIGFPGGQKSPHFLQKFEAFAKAARQQSKIKELGCNLTMHVRVRPPCGWFRPGGQKLTREDDAVIPELTEKEVAQAVRFRCPIKYLAWIGKFENF